MCMKNMLVEKVIIGGMRKSVVAFDTEDLAMPVLWVLGQTGSPRAFCSRGDDVARFRGGHPFSQTP